LPVHVVQELFLDFTGYYRHFMESYCKLVKPLNYLLYLLVGHPTNKHTSKTKNAKSVNNGSGVNCNKCMWKN